MGLNGANGSGKSVEAETDKRRRGTRGGLMQCGTCEEAFCFGGEGVASISAPGNCAQAFLFVLYNIRETFRRLLRINSCLAPVPRLYIISKGTSARSERSGRHLRCAPLPSSSVNPVRIVKWKRSTRGGGLRSSLYYEVQRYENTWDGARRRAWQTPSEKGERVRKDGSRGRQVWRGRCIIHHSKAHSSLI